MIQVIMKDGTPFRFTEEIIGLNEDDILYQKVLTKEEELLRPIKINDKFEYIDNKELLLCNWQKVEN